MTNASAPQLVFDHAKTQDRSVGICLQLRLPHFAATAVPPLSAVWHYDIKEAESSRGTVGPRIR